MFKKNIQQQIDKALYKLEEFWGLTRKVFKRDSAHSYQTSRSKNEIKRPFDCLFQKYTISYYSLLDIIIFCLFQKYIISFYSLLDIIIFNQRIHNVYCLELMICWTQKTGKVVLRSKDPQIRPTKAGRCAMIYPCVTLSTDSRV